MSNFSAFLWKKKEEETEILGSSHLSIYLYIKYRHIQDVSEAVSVLVGRDDTVCKEAEKSSRTDLPKAVCSC